MGVRLSFLLSSNCSLREPWRTSIVELDVSSFASLLESMNRGMGGLSVLPKGVGVGCAIGEASSKLEKCSRLLASSLKLALLFGLRIFAELLTRTGCSATSTSSCWWSSTGFSGDPPSSCRAGLIALTKYRLSRGLSYRASSTT